MSNQQKKNNVAEDAVRARKMLDKNEPTKLNGVKSTPLNLTTVPNKTLGEHAVFVLMTVTNRHQLTMSHPIGITDLDREDWVINRTDDVMAMIKSSADPAQGEINQERAQTRTRLAVDAGFLVSHEEGGRLVFYYPNREDRSRNDLLDDARGAMKEWLGSKNTLLKETKDPGDKQRIALEISRYGGSPDHFMDETTAAAEGRLKEFYQMPEVVELAIREHPQHFRTRGGPFGDEPQCALPAFRGLTIDAAVNKLARALTSGEFHLGGGGPLATDHQDPGRGGVIHPPGGGAFQTTKGGMGDVTKVRRESLLSTMMKKVEGVVSTPFHTNSGKTPDTGRTPKEGEEEDEKPPPKAVPKSKLDKGPPDSKSPVKPDSKTTSQHKG
jgi:hypothetical protein